MTSVSKKNLHSGDRHQGDGPYLDTPPTTQARRVYDPDCPGGRPLGRGEPGGGPFNSATRAKNGRAAGDAKSGPVELTTPEDVDLAIIKSPIVGTFYRAAEPGAKPFADVGETVKKGQVLCIIEAMKLMNEINADCEGEVVKVYVENGQAVHYGERLFAIRPA